MKFEDGIEALSKTLWEAAQKLDQISRITEWPEDAETRAAIKRQQETSPGLEQVADSVKATINAPTAEFHSILSRALNTLGPQKSPEWAVQLADRLFMLEKDRAVTITFNLK